MFESIKSNRFLVLGRAGMDLYAEPPGAEIENANGFFPSLGGSAANIAVAIARLGGQASLISGISDDAVGRYVLNQLQQYGVDTKYVKAFGKEARNSLAVVETRKENCQSVIYRNGAADFLLSETDISKIDFREYGAFVVTGTALALEPSRTATLIAMQNARAANVVVVLDLDYRPYSWSSAIEASSVCKQAVELGDIIVGNDVEFAVLANAEDGQPLAKELAFSRTVIYKLGEKGSITFAGASSFATPIFEVKALKPTGSGDAFLGAFLVSLANGDDLKTSVMCGSAAAAIVVTKVGCAPAMPNSAELNTFIVRTRPLSKKRT